MYKQFLLFLVILLSISNFYSIPTLINQCQEINSSFPFVDSGDRTIILNESVSQNGTCFRIEIDNLNFNCNNFNITGNTSGYGVHLYYVDYSTISNCNIYNFRYNLPLDESNNNNLSNLRLENSSLRGIGMESSSNNNLTNIKIYNATQKGIHVGGGSDNNNLINFEIIQTKPGDAYTSGLTGYSSDYNLFQNFIISDGNKGIAYSNFRYNTFNNISVFDNYYGVSLDYNFVNSIFVNSSFYNNTLYDLEFHDIGNTIENNIFYGNFFGNSSKIIITGSWSNLGINNFTYNGVGNEYGNLEEPNSSLCFDQGVNSPPRVCDYNAIPQGYISVTQIDTQSLFPSQSFLSLILILLPLFIYFR